MFAGTVKTWLSSTRTATWSRACLREKEAQRGVAGCI